MGRRKLSQSTLDQIPVLYEKYKNKAKVAEELDISVSTVSKYLNGAAAQQENKEQKERTKITPEIIEQINALYAECRNMSQVARELNISNTSVATHLTDENKNLKNKEYEERDALWFYIYRLFGEESDGSPVSNWNIVQMNKFNKMGITYLAQLLTLKYYYEVQGHHVQKQYRTIGIIPYIYNEASNYYKNQQKKIDELEAAVREQLERDRIEIKYNPRDYIGKKKKKKMIDLNSIEVNED